MVNQERVVKAGFMPFLLFMIFGLILLSQAQLYIIKDNGWSLKVEIRVDFSVLNIELN